MDVPDGADGAAVLSTSGTHVPVCPSWCCLDHTKGHLLAHESETIRAEVSQPHTGAAEALHIRTVQYRPLHGECASPPWDTFVEIEHHVDSRYRIINLTADEARSLATVLLTSASQSQERGNFDEEA